MSAEAKTFVDHVHQESAFLTTHGFLTVQESDTEVMFESPSGVFVRFLYSPREEWVGFRVGLLSEPRDAVSDAELARLAGVTSERHLTGEGGLGAAVAESAAILRQLGARALQGDPSVFEDASSWRWVASTRASTSAGDTARLWRTLSALKASMPP